MLEGWASDLLAGYLGHFFEVKKEQLRISLWSAWSTGLVLEDLKLKPGSFEYLDLPFAVQEGRIGRLEIKIPWRALNSSQVVVEVSDIWLLAKSRSPSDWEEGPASRRKLAARQAQLESYEADPQSHVASSTEKERSGFMWSFLTQLGSILLNRLQLKIHRVHLQFQSEDPTAPKVKLGIVIHSFQTTQFKEGWFAVEAESLEKGQIVKDLVLEGLTFFVEPEDSTTPRSSLKGTKNCRSSMNETECPLEVLGTTFFEGADIGPQRACMLKPVNVSARLSLSPGESNANLAASIEDVQIDARSDEVKALLQLNDALKVWNLRTELGFLCPTGWRTGQSPQHVWRSVWRYAIQAVILLQSRRQVPHHEDLQTWQEHQRSYMSLLRDGTSALTIPESQTAKSKLKKLERSLSMQDVLLFRTLAKTGFPVSDSSAVDSEEGNQRKGWFSGFSNAWAYVPYFGSPSLPAPPTDSDMQDLYKDLDILPNQAQLAAPQALGNFDLNVNAQMSNITITASNCDQLHPFATLEAHQVAFSAELQRQQMHLEASCQDVSVMHSPTNSQLDQEQLLFRWHHDTWLPETSLSMVQLKYDDNSLSSGGKRALELIFQPLQAVVRPRSFLQFQRFFEGTASHQLNNSKHLASGLDLRSPPEAQPTTVEKPLGLKFKVLDALIVNPGRNGHRCIMMQTGLINVSTPEPTLEAEPSELAGGQSDRLAVTISGTALFVGPTFGSAEGASYLLRPAQLAIDIRTGQPDMSGSITYVSAELGKLVMSAQPDTAADIAHAVECMESDLQVDLKPAQCAESTPCLDKGNNNKLELHLTVKSLQASYEDASSYADCSLASHSMTTDSWTISATVAPNAFELRVSVIEVEALDSSTYLILPPPIKATIPRLAREMLIDRFNLLVKQSKQHGLTVSAEAVSALALGYEGELGNFILRGHHGVPPIGRFTYSCGPEPAEPEVHITLQDGCFGIAMLMRIAALFTSTHTPSEEAVKEALQQSEQGNAGLIQVDTPISLQSLTEGLKIGPELQEDRQVEQVNGRESKGRGGQETMAASPASVGDIADSITKAYEETAGRQPKDLKRSLDRGVQNYQNGGQGVCNHGKKLTALERQQSEASSQNGAHQADSSPFAKVAGEDGGGSYTEAAADRSQISTPSPAGSAEEPVESADRFSLEIIRCRAVCPDWRDNAVHATSAGRPDTLVFGIPNFLLQLPLGNPAVHPVRHQVEEAFDPNFPAKGEEPENAAEALEDQSDEEISTGDLPLPTPFGAPAITTQDKRIIALSNFLTLQVAVFDRGKPGLQHLTAPFLSIPRIKFNKVEEDATENRGLRTGDLFSCDVPNIALTVTSRQTEALVSTALWASRQWDQILGSRLDMETVPPTAKRSRKSPEKTANIEQCESKSVPTSKEIKTERIEQKQNPAVCKETPSASSPAGGDEHALQAAPSKRRAPVNRIQVLVSQVSVHLCSMKASEPVVLAFAENLSSCFDRFPPDEFHGSFSLGKIGLRFLDVPLASSGSDSDGDGLVTAHSLAQKRRSGGRLQKALSAPAPPLLSMFSRTGSATSGDSGGKQSLHKPAGLWNDSGEVEEDSIVMHSPFAQPGDSQIGVAGLAEIAQFADTRRRSIGSKAARWSNSASQLIRKNSSGFRDLQRASSGLRSLRQSIASSTTTHSPSHKSSIVSDDSDSFISAQSRELDMFTWSGRLNSGEESFYDASEARRGSSSLSVSHSGTLAEGVDQEMPDPTELAGVDLLLLRGYSDGPATLSMTQTSPDAISAAANGLHIRVNLVGLELAGGRLKQIANAIAKAVAGDKESRTSYKPHVDKQHPENSKHAAVTNISLQKSEVVVDLIAAPLQDDSEVAPAASVHLTGDVLLTAQAGSLRDCSIGLDSTVISLHIIDSSKGIHVTNLLQDLGPVAALRDFKFQMTSPIDGHEDSHDAACCVSIRKISVWASQASLILLAGLVANVGDQSSVGDVPDNENDFVDAIKIEEILQGHMQAGCSLKIDKFAVILFTGQQPNELPLLEAAVLDIDVALRSPSEGLLRTRSQARLAANVFSTMRGGWEPILEQWEFYTEVSIDVGSPFSSGDRERLISLQSPFNMEVTVGTSLMRAARVCQLMGGRMAAVLRHQEPLQAAVNAEYSDITILGQKIFQLQNFTGASVDFWMVSEGQQLKPPRPQDCATIKPGECTDIKVYPESSSDRAPKYAESPETFFTANYAPLQPQLTALQRALTQAVVPVHVLRQKVIYLRLSHQEGHCGPIAVEDPACHHFPITLRRVRSSGMGSTARLVCRVTHHSTGSCTLTLHSGIQIVNRCSVGIALGLRQKVVSLTERPEELGEIEPGGCLWLPVMRPEPGIFCLKPTGVGAPMEGYGWSAGIRVQPFLEQCDSEEGRVARQVSCSASRSHAPTWRFNVGVTKDADSSGWIIAIRAAMVLKNSLPMPVHVNLKSPAHSPLERHVLNPQQEVLLHSVVIQQIEEVVIRPLGYQWSPPISLPKLHDSHEPPRRPTPEQTLSFATGFVTDKEGETRVRVEESGEGRGSVTVRLKHILERECGSHLLQISCSLWVYNCAGLPLALQQSLEEEESMQMDVADDVPKQWLPPYEGPQRPTVEPLSREASSVSSISLSQTSSRANLQGLGQALLPPPAAQRHMSIGESAGLPEDLSRRGSIDLTGLPSQQQLARWPSMQGGFTPKTRTLKLQLRASQMCAPAGQTFWSTPVRLYALGGAAVVTVPCPLQNSVQSLRNPAVYMLAVTATQVVGGDGALAVRVMPRHVLQNSLPAAVQYKQQGSNVERELKANGARAVHWPDSRKALRLCIRMQGAGWLWSGGLSLNTPGDFFVKIRHKDRGVTMLVRVDISSDASGSLLITLSDQGTGFAPYRLDNCTPFTLHISQQANNEQEDVLRPYSALDYAWDEPALPHKLIIALPGNRRLGVFNLDKVGHMSVLNLKHLAKQADCDRKLQVLVQAEGPTRVLSIIDLQTHASVQPSRLKPAMNDDQGWELWSGRLDQAGTFPGRLPLPMAGHQLEVKLELAGIGLSYVVSNQEVVYARASGVNIRATDSTVRNTLELGVQGIQVDNPSRTAAYPVMAACPHVSQRFGLPIVTDRKAVRASGSQAVAARLSVWRRRPAGVLCLERMEVRIAPIVLEIEQQHAFALIAAVSTTMEPFGLNLSKPKRARETMQSYSFRGTHRKRHSDLKIYVEYLLISQITITVSFLPIDWNSLRSSLLASAAYLGTMLRPAQQRLLSLVGDIEGGCIRLQQLEVRHPLLSLTALTQQASSHYTNSALRELVKLVGSANLLGDPVSLFHHLGLGFWSLVANPAAGLVESAQGKGPQRIAEGFIEGLYGLLANTVYGFSNATLKASTSARKVLAVLGAEGMVSRPMRLHQAEQPPSRNGIIAFVAAFFNGLLGIISEPARGYDESGASGFLRGAYRGVVGAVLAPVVNVLETCAGVAERIRDRVIGPPEVVPRLRPPRYVSAVGGLAPYDRNEAIGRYLLNDIEGGCHATEEFLMCRQHEDESDFTLLTSQHLLCVRWPGLRFFASLRFCIEVRDILHVRRDGRRVVVLALQPPFKTINATLLRSKRLVRPGPQPYFSAILTYKDEASSKAMAQALSDASSSILLTGRGQTLTNVTCGRLMTAEDLELGADIKALSQRQAWVKQILRVSGREAK